MLIETARLRLRRLETKDIPAVVAGLNDWTIAQWLARTPFPYTAADAEAWLAETDAPYAAGRFAIADKTSDCLIGSIGLEDGTEMRELGYWLAIDHWGRGLMSEAVAAIVRHGFDSMGARLLFATADPDNAASQRVLLKAGFRRVGDEAADPPTRRGHASRPLFELRRPG